MQYATLDLNGTPHVAVVGSDSRYSLCAGGQGTTLDVLLAHDAAERDAALAPGSAAPEDARLDAPVRSASVIAIGLNYLDHIRETGMERPGRPLVFSKLRSSIVGPEATIRLPQAITQQVDWEVELAAVIGRTTRHVTPEDALDHVFGYTVANDVSARDVQFGDGQWVRGKSLDTFCPLGPVVVTPDELGDPQRLKLRTRVNGKIRQDSSTSEMLFGTAELISFCSHSFTLHPGDLLLTGTPWGCGAFMDPPQYLNPGDVVEVEVEGIGSLRNPVEAA